MLYSSSGGWNYVHSFEWAYSFDNFLRVHIISLPEQIFYWMQVPQMLGLNSNLYLVFFGWKYGQQRFHLLQLNKDDSELFLCTLWVIWKAQNKWENDVYYGSLCTMICYPLPFTLIQEVSVFKHHLKRPDFI